MCYNLIIYNSNATDKYSNIERFTSIKLNKFKNKNNLTSEKFNNLDIKTNKKKNTIIKKKEKFNDIVDKGLLDGALNIFKSNNKNTKNKKTSNSKSNSTSKYTIDDVINRSEKIQNGIGKLSTDTLKTQAIDYYKSFKTEKFSANSKSTAEALDKFKLFKEKFFDIFK